VWRALLSRAVARRASDAGGQANGPALGALVLAAALCEKTDTFLRRAPPLKVTFDLQIFVEKWRNGG